LTYIEDWASGAFGLTLAIIQDSKSDEEFHAGQMALVYSNVYLTVSASGSQNGTGGCCMVAEDMSYGPVDIECRDSELDAESESPSKRRFRVWATPPLSVGQVLRNDPLSVRGWTLQERELSPRIVHYSRDNVRWECRELKALLEFPWGDTTAFNGSLRLFDNGQLDSPTLSVK
jgi:hypothetical protein